VKKTSDELRRDSGIAARQALELRQLVDGLGRRAKALEQLSDALLRRSVRVSLKTKPPARRRRARSH
jgi:hypothetical protein